MILANSENSNNMNVTVKIMRDQQKCDYYDVPYVQGMSLLNVLTFIYERIDTSLAFPLCLCRIGKCGNCAVRLNGRNVLACSTMVSPGAELLVEAIQGREVIKDLVVKG